VACAAYWNPVILARAAADIDRLADGRMVLGLGSGTEFQRTYFRAGHAHAGVLLVLSLVYYQYLAGTTVADGMQWLACVVLVAGILAQSGGFFLHMAVGRPDAPSSGTLLTTVGAVLLAADLLFLAYALIGAYPD
jgi:hypothetical protein